MQSDRYTYADPHDPPTARGDSVSSAPERAQRVSVRRRGRYKQDRPPIPKTSVERSNSSRPNQFENEEDAFATRPWSHKYAYESLIRAHDDTTDVCCPTCGRGEVSFLTRTRTVDVIDLLPYLSVDRAPANFTASPGQLTAIVGRSGSGKTGLLSCISGATRPTSGTIWLGGSCVTQLSGRQLQDFRRKNVGVIYLTASLVTECTVLENVALPLVLCGAKRNFARSRATELLDGLDMAGRAKFFPDQLSRAQIRRVAIARALVNDPSVLLADEPTVHLERTDIEDVCRLLRSTADSGKTVIVTTDETAVLRCADQIVEPS
jgi:putative ABC transport system ATP-binding protein